MMRTFVLLLVGVSVAGCMGGSVESQSESGTASGGGSGTGGGSGGGTGGGAGGLHYDPCSPAKTSGVDPIAKGFASCCTKGDAHCLPAGAVASNVASAFKSCDSGGSCMPDKIIRQGTTYEPAACTSLQSAKGVCLSKCIPQVADNPQSILLPQDTCAEDELCVPCINPITNMPTGACGIIEQLCGGGGSGTGTGTGGTGTGTTPPAMCPYNGPPIINPSTLAACAPACGGAHCIAADLVPAAEKSQLSACTATGGAPGLCAPDPIIAAGGNYIPPSCLPFPGTTAEGRCESGCLAAVKAQAARLVQATCGVGDLCVPCNDPLTGVATGACTTSCDMPKQPPFKFATCFMGEATCVPTTQVPADQQASLQQLTCTTGSLCVPNEYLPGSTLPIGMCTGAFGSKGTCVSKAAKLPLGGILFQQAECSADHVCVTCALASSTPGCSTPAAP